MLQKFVVNCLYLMSVAIQYVATFLHLLSYMYIYTVLNNIAMGN